MRDTGLKPSGNPWEWIEKDHVLTEPNHIDLESGTEVTSTTKTHEES